MSQKVCYPTKAAAIDAAEQLMEQAHVMPGCHLTPYPCQDCGRWHIYNRQIVPVPAPWSPAS